MPQYALRCLACEHRFETFARAADREAIPCPECHAPHVETDFSKLVIRDCNRVFRSSESMSVTNWFAPDDVDFFRRAYGGDCIKDDGSVVFTDRKEEKQYRARRAAWEKREKDKAISKAQKARDDARTIPLDGDPAKRTGRRRALQQSAS